jgi:iron complex outermembrane receptor protein
LVVCLFADQAVAHTPDSESGFFEEMPVVLSASRLPQPLSEAPAAVTVLDRDFIRATGYRDIGRLFRLVPGFTVVQDRGHTSVPSYHGLAASFASNKMQVLIDGRSVYSNYLAGGVDWGGLPITIDEIERIEIVRGSSSATYGSNAFLGVVNIITRHSAEDGGAMLSALGGNLGQIDGAARVGASLGDLSLRVSGAHRQDDGFKAIADNRRNSVVTLRADYRLSSRAEITFSAGLNSSLRGLGYAGDAGNGTRDLDSLQEFVHLRWRYAPDPDAEWSAGYYHNTERGRELQVVPNLPPPYTTVDNSRVAHRDNVDVQHYFRPFTSLRLLWGGELRREEVSGDSFFPGDPGRSTSVGRVFANAEWRLADPLLINLGGLYEKFQGQSARLAPRLFANWQIAPGHTLRGGLLRAYREPSLWEQKGNVEFGPFIGIQSQGRLDPERVVTQEIGYLGRLPFMSSVLDVRLYRERVNDLVALQARKGLPRLLVNQQDEVRIRGIEWQWKAHPTDSTDLIWSHALTRIESASPVARSSAPPYSASLTWQQRYGRGFSSMVSLINVGTTEWLDSQSMPSYTTWDGRLAWRFRAGASDNELAVGLINGGARHEEWRLPGRPPNPADPFWYVSLRTEF